jgi:hypothetical protein
MKAYYREAGRGRHGHWWVYAVVMAVLAFTGFGQMPVFKRYYISSIPGMAWSADFYVTLFIHYLAAVILLGLIAYVATEYLAAGRKEFRITPAGYLRMGLLAGMVVTGLFRVFKNLPYVDFSPGFTMAIDISHLALMMAYGAAALLFWRIRARWVVERTN